MPRHDHVYAPWQGRLARARRGLGRLAGFFVRGRYRRTQGIKRDGWDTVGREEGRWMIISMVGVANATALPWCMHKAEGARVRGCSIVV